MPALSHAPGRVVDQGPIFLDGRADYDMTSEARPDDHRRDWAVEINDAGEESQARESSNSMQRDSSIPFELS
jgi:hypothetical protein